MQSKFPILVVDDDPLLAEILTRASRNSFPEASFKQIYSADEAIQYINGLNGYGPKLVLLDIDLGGRLNGFGFLALLRAHPEARFLPVVILTISQLADDVQASYSVGASSFTVKPFSYEDWILYLSNLRLYWLETVTLPPIRFKKVV